MLLFFDLDGPLLDVSPRYITLHGDLLNEVEMKGMAGELYWRNKRARVPEERILSDLGAFEHARHYLRRRRELIETPEYLVYDRCWPWVEEVLTKLAIQHDLVLVTVRTHRPALLEELDRLNMTRFFREVLSEPSEHNVARQKADLIEDFLQRHRQLPQGNWMVGDTEVDIDAGRIVGLRTAAVLCGIRDWERLAGAKPDVLMDDIRELAQSLVPLPGHYGFHQTHN